LVDSTLDEIIISPDLKNYEAAKSVLISLRKLATQRNLRDVSYNVIGLVNSGEVDEAMSTIKSAISLDKDRIDVGGYIDDFPVRFAIIEERDKDKDKKSDIIPTGIKQFDDMAGGIMKGEVGIAVGKTGGGKSILKLNIGCVNWFQGYNVIHFGLEMTKVENQFRADTLFTQIPAVMFRLAKLRDQEKMKWFNVIKELKNSKKSYLEFVGGKGMTMPEIFSTVDRIEFEKGQKVDVVIIDHIVLVRREGNKYEQFSRHWDNFQDFSEWCKEHYVAGWTSTQSTDEGIKSKSGADVTSVKYARAIAELAQIAMSIYQSEADKLSGDLNIKVIKGRGIKSGDKFVVRPDFNNMVLDTLSFYQLGIDKLGEGK
jgi:hypothetical protein